MPWRLWPRREGDFDIVYCDIDKDGYPDAWELGKEKVRRRRLLHLRQHAVVRPGDGAADDQAEWTEAIKETNELIAADPAWRSIINPTRDGVVTALRIA